ncbi:MAG: MutS-related protein [Limisphaerales bacterium]
MEPRKEYAERLAKWSQKAEHYELRHRRTGNLRVLLAVVLVVAAVLLRNAVSVGFLFTGVLIGLYLSGMIHDRILDKRDAARRMVGFYERGLDRLRDRWAGKGSAGTEFLDKQHPYAIDLDIFGTGSLFELINIAQTQAGRAMLAQWLLQRAAPGEVEARQTAVAEMRSKLDLREELAMRADDPRAHIDTNALVTWAALPPHPPGKLERIAALGLPLITWALLLLGDFRLSALAFGAQCALALVNRSRTNKTLASMKSPARDLWWLAELLSRLESESFRAPRLQELQAKWKSGGVSASASLRRLARVVDCLDTRNNFAVALIGPFLLLITQFAFALEAWHARHGAMIEDWLMALGEMEALSSLAGYAYEHPADVFPEWMDKSASPLIEAQGLAHPLIAESRAVRNDILLDSHRPLHVVSGSNMSGKSTWLRAIGVNLVLGMAGAPVRARAFRMTPLRIGASIRTVDSLQEGVSRFYAEIKRLRQIIQLTEQPPPLVFLIDEVLGGTNSHDRQIGAAYIVKALVQRGALGLITTHDLALTQVAEEVKPPGANFHFEDQLANGKLSFDYRLRPGVVKKSNALDLMRSIGLDV